MACKMWQGRQLFKSRGTVSWRKTNAAEGLELLPRTTLLDRTADTVVALQRRTQIGEQESDLRAPHLLQARRPAEHHLHRYYLECNNSEAPGH